MMTTKAKKFSHKLLALFMAVLMALTCFTGVLTAYGSSIQDYHDNNVEYNSLAWDVLSDEQTATALLDYADTMLAEYGPVIDNLLAGALPTSGMYFYNASSRSIGLNVGGIIKADIKVYVHSVDEIMETLESVASVLSKFDSFIGDAGNLQLGSTKGVRRSNTSSCDIIRCVLGILQKNSADYNGKDVIGSLLRGTFDLGTVGSLAKLDLYDLIGNMLGLDDGYESNLVYNLVQSLIFNNTKWYTADEIAAFKNGSANWVYDTQLLDKMTTELLDKISVLVTYDQEYTEPVLNEDGSVSETGTKIKDNSETRYAEIKAYMDSKGVNYATAASALGYDPNLVYSDEFTTADGGYKNILLFAYGSPDSKGLATKSTQMIKLSETDSLFDFGYQALKMAWSTVLKDSVKLIHVNNNVDRGHGSNFDNVYYYYMTQVKHQWTGNPAVDYSKANVQAWIESAYETYGAESAAEFEGWVKHNYEFDRSVAADAQGIWSDIDETTLFNKLRYSPLADYYFDMQTGPINLYFLQLGTPNLDEFFKNDYASYSSMTAAFNDLLVAAVKDVFVDSDNIEGTLPTMLETNDIPTIDASGIANITSTLVSNALAVVQYTADATDKNILNGFYKANGTKLTEQNLESAMLPMLIACIGQVNLGSGKLERVIHAADWNACQNAEAVVFLALREYLSYVLPDKDYNALVNISETSIEAKNGDMLNNVILPMARDAVSYVMQGYVPVADKNGEAWNVYDRAVNDESTIFDLLNSVICYYADDYDMAKSDDRSMGVASLLGICDANGNSLINASNDIWTNIDLVANKLMPVLGTLQYGNANSYGKFSSKDLIWNDIVCGVLDIGDTSIHTSGMGGVSNFLNKLITIVTAAPIQTTPIVTTVYDALADLINGLFGGRYNGQDWTTVVPKASSTHPFDDLVQVKQLAGTSGSDVGALQKVICNFVEFAGYGTSGLATYPDSILRGICFALQAINSFVPEALNNIADHSMKMATAEFENAKITGASGANTGNVVITNNSIGVNNAYVDGMNNGSINQLTRYYIKVTGASISGTGSSSISSPNNAIIAPGETLSLSTSTRYAGTTADPTSSYEAVITYDIVDKDGNAFVDANGNKLFQGLQSSCYQYMNAAQAWKDIVYPENRIENGLNRFPEALEPDAGNSKTLSGYKTYATSGFGKDNYLNVIYPEYMVLSTENLADISTFNFRLKNTSNKYTGPERSVDGMFFYDTKTVESNNLTTAVTKYSSGASTTNVSVDSTNAIPVYDKNTGDLLRQEMYDYRVETAVGSGVYGEWQRNYVNEKTHSDNSAINYYKGYTEDEISAQITDANNKGLKIETRTHVVFTLQEALDNKIVAAYHINANDVFDYMYLKTNGGGLNYDNTLNMITMRGPVDGIYMNSTKIKQAKNSSQYFQFMRYDGSTSIQAGSYAVNLNFYNSSSCGYASFTLVVGDTSSASSLNTAYNNLSDTMASYRPQDFKDYKNGESAVYNSAKDALLNALAAQSAVLTPTSALALSDNTVLTATTTTTTSATGDKAFAPFVKGVNDSAMPNTVKDAAYVGGETKNGVTNGGIDGVYYFDAACTMPIYSNTPLTSANNGKDAAGVAVTKIDGVFYLANAVHYETEWDTTSFSTPWAKPTNVQATDSKGAKLYDQVQYVYRDANGNKVNSDDDWACKFPVTTFALIPNDPDSGMDNRGTITQAADYIAYTLETVQANINTSIAQTLYDDMTKVRTGMNENNFEVITFNKMVEAANAAERYYSVTLTYNAKDDKGNVETVTETLAPTKAVSRETALKNDGIDVAVSTTSTLSSAQVDEYMRLFNFYMSKVVERGYLGDQIEAEIAHSGNAWNNMKATVATYNEDGTIATPAVVTKTSAAAAPTYGAWAADGTLVNEGATVYSENSWTAYVTALANAIDIATLGNGSYAHKTEAYYNAADKENYGAAVSKCYDADTALQIAENTLTPSETALVTVTPVEGADVTVNGAAYVSPLAFEVGDTVTIDVQVADGYVFENTLLVNGDKVFVESMPYEIYLNGDITVEAVVSKVAAATVNVSASLVVATTADGATSGTAVNGDYTVTVYDEAGEEVAQETFAMSADNNTFSFDLAPGTYTATIESAYSLIRDDITIIAGDADVEGPAIPIIACDFNGNGSIAANDALTVYAQAAGGGALYCDLNGNGAVAANDALIVYAIAAGGGIDLEAITIQ
ncbi:MAG: hypothetical protein NC397_04315 [Clostridium sp.]|nr:hypothetical protein [Clostridium sp.]